MPVEPTDSFVRVRQVDPSLFQKESFRRVNIATAAGIKAVVGRRPGSDAPEIQTFLFDRTKWSIDKAKAWVADNKNNAQASLLFAKRTGRAVAHGTTAFAAALRDTSAFQKFLKQGAHMATATTNKGKIEVNQ